MEVDRCRWVGGGRRVGGVGKGVMGCVIIAMACGAREALQWRLWSVPVIYS